MPEWCGGPGPRNEATDRRSPPAGYADQPESGDRRPFRSMALRPVPDGCGRLGRSRRDRPPGRSPAGRAAVLPPARRRASVAALKPVRNFEPPWPREPSAR